MAGVLAIGNRRMAGSSSLPRNASVHSRRRAQHAAVQTPLRSERSVPIRSRRARRVSGAEWIAISPAIELDHPCAEGERRRRIVLPADYADSTDFWHLTTLS